MLDTLLFVISSIAGWVNQPVELTLPFKWLVISVPFVALGTHQGLREGMNPWLDRHPRVAFWVVLPFVCGLLGLWSLHWIHWASMSGWEMFAAWVLCSGLSVFGFVLATGPAIIFVCYLRGHEVPKAPAPSWMYD